jgi:hypothetical protein
MLVLCTCAGLPAFSGKTLGGSGTASRLPRFGSTVTYIIELAKRCTRWYATTFIVRLIVGATIGEEKGYRFTVPRAQWQLNPYSLLCLL